MGFLNRPLKKNLESRKHKIWQDVVSTKNALSMGKTVRCAWILPLLQNRTAVVLVLVLNLSQKKCSYCYNSLDGISKPLMRRRKNKMRLWNIFFLTLAICLICATPVSQQWGEVRYQETSLKGTSLRPKRLNEFNPFILTTKWKKRIPCEYSHENQEKEESNDFYKMMINPIEAMHLLELWRKVLGWHLNSWASSLVWWQASRHHHQHHHPHHHQ